MAYGCYTIPGYFYNAVIKGNEIIESGKGGKVLYKIKGDSIVEADWVGKTVLKFESGYIKEPGFFGRTLFYVDEDGNVTEPKLFFASKVGYFPAARRISTLDKINTEIDKTTGERHVHYDNTPSYTPTYTPSYTPSYVLPKKEEPKEVEINITVTTGETKNYLDNPYNEVAAYAKFLQKYGVCKSPLEMKEDEYAHFEFLKCGVKDINKLHKELFDNEFYRLANLKEKLSIYKASQIKDVATKLGIKNSGKKDELIERINMESNLDSVNSVLTDTVYVLSEKAERWLKDHEIDIEYYFKNPLTNLSINEYKEIRKNTSFEDILEEAGLKDVELDKRNYGRNIFFSLAGSMAANGYNEKALFYYLMTLRIDMSGVFAYRAIAEFPEEKQFRDKKCAEIFFAPGLLSLIHKYLEYFDEQMIEDIYAYKLPIDASDPKLFSFMVNSLINDVGFDSKQIKLYLEKRFEEIVSQI